MEANEPLELVVLDQDQPKAMARIGTKMDPKTRQALNELLVEHKDVFAWSHEDVPGIDNVVVEHRLCVDLGAKKVWQKCRSFSTEKYVAIAEVVDCLLDAGFIREACYPEWLSIVVIVKKSNRKWRMWVDITDLNKAWHKDSFPLLRIDLIVDSMARHHMLSFTDAYSRYNQIRMNPKDEEKTSFITNRGLYYYQVMPFGLKNAGATNQRFRNYMSKKQIGHNMEVYVDNLLVKSKELKHHLADLREAFAVLRQYKMNLNLMNCAFGVDLSKFLELKGAKEFIRKFEKCQLFAPVLHCPPSYVNYVTLTVRKMGDSISSALYLLAKEV